jgi:hypothetical protein
MWRRAVRWIITNISVEHDASIFDFVFPEDGGSLLFSGSTRLYRVTSWLFHFEDGGSRSTETLVTMSQTKWHRFTQDIALLTECNFCGIRNKRK